jgi:4'-phosphopantetheinyl transferase
MIELVQLLHGHACSVWCFSLDQLPNLDQQACLSEAEVLRAEKFVYERDQRRYLAAHVQLRQLLSNYVRLPAQTLEFVEGSLGKPALRGGQCAFNLSHSGDWAAVVAAAQGHLGVDIELLQQVPDAVELARENFTVAEVQSLLETPQGAERDLAFLRGWTRKEACLKALGTGLSLPANQIHTGLTAGSVSVQAPWKGQAITLTVESFQHEDMLVGAVASVVTPHFSL